MVEAQSSLGGLDDKTKQFMIIALLTAHRNPDGVKMHSMMAKKLRTSLDEIKGAVVMNFDLSGLSTVLDCLPAALEGYEMVIE